MSIGDLARFTWMDIAEHERAVLSAKIERLTEQNKTLLAALEAFISIAPALANATHSHIQDAYDPLWAVVDQYKVAVTKARLALAKARGE